MSEKKIGCLATIAILCALTTLIILLTSKTETVFASFPLQLLGLACLVGSLGQTRSWWMLAPALILAVPLMLWVVLIIGFFYPVGP